jgi:hypothetical protein
MATEVTFRFLPGAPWWATSPRVEGFVQVRHPAEGTGPQYALPGGLHAIPQGTGVFEFEGSVDAMRAAMRACGHAEIPGETGPAWSPAERAARAGGLERAIEILRESNGACGDMYHDGCGCQAHLVHSMDLEARALRGEEF